ncbi:44233_t:CDS:2 [Gigaspora margarita]|uniref:44233_t:CDS:1 n=1 Tax=Gigaspora margarita TaxID=4874 RepID=A0ABN7URL5_GIGMA|nr:44233_t:CDS:2 [Gigaspora margarita]
MSEFDWSNINPLRLVTRISIVKAEKARTVEDLVIRMAQSGRLRGKVSESQLIDLLQQVNP